MENKVFESFSINELDLIDFAINEHIRLLSDSIFRHENFAPFFASDEFLKKAKENLETLERFSDILEDVKKKKAGD